MSASAKGSSCVAAMVISQVSGGGGGGGRGALWCLLMGDDGRGISAARRILDGGHIDEPGTCNLRRVGPRRTAADTYTYVGLAAILAKGSGTLLGLRSDGGSWAGGCRVTKVVVWFK